MITIRRFMQIVESAERSPLDAALISVATYIEHNDPCDFHAVSAVLQAHGYREVIKQTRFFRFLFHEVTPEEKAAHKTVGEFVEAVIKPEGRMLLDEPQGFTTSLAKAHQFGHGTMFYAYDPVPLHNAASPLEAHRSVAVIYEVEATPEAVLFSMRGLKQFIRALPPSEGTKALHHALYQSGEGFGYGSDDEVVLDPAKGVKIVGIHLYDNTERWEEDNL